MGKGRPRWKKYNMDYKGEWVEHPRSTICYCERTSWGHPRKLMGRQNFVCMECRVSKKSNYSATCQICGKPMKGLGLTGRPPKKDCSPAAWKKFEAFVKAGNFHPIGCR